MICVSFVGCAWSQLSYWAAVVVTNFVDAMPLTGKRLKLFALRARAARDSVLKRRVHGGGGVLPLCYSFLRLFA